MSVRWSVDESRLDPVFHTDINDLLAASPYAWDVTAGFRSMLEQGALYDAYIAAASQGQRGNLAAPPGRSAHNWGLAVDVAVLTANGPSWDYTDGQWQWLWAACDAHPRLRSGHTFGDDDHIQAVAWFAKRAELKRLGKW